MTAPTTRTSAALVDYVTGLGDDALVLSHRLAEWITRAPQLEEDIALANISLDLLGQARTLLGYAGELEGGGAGTGRSEDDLAYLRDEREFRNLQIVEIGNGDFAVTIARQFAVSYYQFELYRRLAQSSDAMIAGIAAKAVKEVDYHRDHSAQWVLRLALGTEESRARMIHGLAVVWPYVDELFRDDELTGRLSDAGVAVQPSSLRADFDRLTGEVLAEAELEVPKVQPAPGGGRRGLHSEHLGYLLAEMQVLAREHPGASW